MAPLGYAVSLINDYHGQGHLGKALGKIGGLQFFRCHVEQLDPAPVQVPKPLDGFIIGNRTVYIGSGNALFQESLYLVLHERNQG